MSPALNGSSALQHFERSNIVKIRNGIMFNFYPGLPHIPTEHAYTASMLVNDTWSFFIDMLPFAGI